ncbi:FlgO family outer membrane protein [Bowmanella denitrificans]|uniref:FlgO family outer membrane protein n=1 Tax=Bowmanella denitrificans TaxID=366582 RepID=UPI000C9C9F30|nr:FlgO family outer membrane protein [Bowmanella denitrificans]
MKRLLPCLLALTACHAMADAVADMTHEQWQTEGKRFVPPYHHKRLADYVEQMVFDMDQHALAALEGNILVASFVDLDDSLSSTSMLGNQLAENFMQQMRKQGYPVAESKATGNVMITQTGDLVFSRTARKVRQAEYCCVLSGTLIYGPSGIEVNARVFEHNSQAVLASASGLIPYFVVSHLGQLQ